MPVALRLPIRHVLIAAAQAEHRRHGKYYVLTPLEGLGLMVLAGAVFGAFRLRRARLGGAPTAQPP